MVVPVAIRTTLNEKRYVPAFFQNGTKVLIPVHGYGYTDIDSKPYAEMQKKIYLNNLNVGNMFKLGQRVGVCVNEIAASGELEEDNYWSDATIIEVNETEHYIKVLLDNPIGIKWGGESEITFQTTDVSAAHLWQTADEKCYVTAMDYDITDEDLVIYNPSDMITDRMVLACTLDKYILQTKENTQKWFVIETYNHYSMTGSYIQRIPNDYTEYWVGGENPNDMYFDARSPMFWDRFGHCDGSIVEIHAKTTKTWFKDRSFIFHIRGELIPADAENQLTKTFQPGSVIYVSNPFNVANELFSIDPQPHRFVIAPPSKVDAVSLPIDTNLWCHGQINGDEKAFVCEFRPAIDEQGMPYVKNIGNTTISTSGDETICVYDEADTIDEKFKDCTFDVFMSSPTAENDLYIGGQVSMDKFTLDIGDANVPNTTLEQVFQYATLDGVKSYIKRSTYPVMLSKVSIMGATSPNKFTTSVGSWEDAEYFNGKIWFISGSVLKPTNQLLEFDPEDTIEIPSAVIGIKALANQLFVMTEGGIYTVNLKNEMQFLTSVVARMWSAVGESLYIVDEKGRIYNTEFTPVPVQDQRKNTDNPYMVLAINTGMIQDIADQWTVFDIKSAHDMLWVASNMGLWAMESSTKAWFKVSNDVFIHLVNAGSEIFGITGTMTTEQEMSAIDLIKLMDSDKEIGS